jgi:redox-sensitive bicupin YhaK (pirin superfamily)
VESTTWARHSPRWFLLSGEDPNEPVVAYGPFIMNTQEEIAEAFDRYRAGKMGRLEAVHVSA